MLLELQNLGKSFGEHEEMCIRDRIYTMYTRWVVAMGTPAFDN